VAGGGVVTNQYFVAVIGAGPARELANKGARVVIFNRDIKPGGLAEYGIYPNKHTMKRGLRKQFRQVLDVPNLDYYGNITVGAQGDLSLADLRACITPRMLSTITIICRLSVKSRFPLENVVPSSARAM
jgi:ferredoxin--NADP+ reductase